ncbi:hypothetical protein HN51_061833 [Arachis hypogaea]|uniref:RPW8 domain-containing protein n=1 Tax=Arachis hypogaea TaxID=3818 RepID=A0A445APX4_ARAHY|nr:probable disease resistance protein At5g66900 [Arachis ipaensis]XP_025627154.1 probable disease resistance protein At5g66900 [Arachis hypogaea]QHO19189.1 putative disease resistance protein [Arachis hypogaea]RYR28488.1 hypothetical protein Ahy_B01g052625 [Arachis hypogaea]
MSVVIDALVGGAIEALLDTVIEIKEKNDKFKPSLEKLETTLKSLKPFIKQIEGIDAKLDRPKSETERLIKKMESGKNLVLKCSKLQWWDCCGKANRQEELEELYDSICEFFKLELQAINTRDVKEALVGVRDIQGGVREIQVEIGKLSKMVPRNERVELRGVCSPPKPPAFIVGFDVPLKQLKLKLMDDRIGDHPVVLTVTGAGGSGKSTLAKMLCWDDEVKDKFNDNIFFVTFGKKPKLSTIVQKLFQHTGYETLEFQSDEEMLNQIENLLNQLVRKNPILLVLDDVWPGSESLVDKFEFHIKDYKILVTSRVVIGRFGNPIVLKPLGDADAIKLFQHSASLNHSSSDVPDDVVKEIVRGCSGSPMALRVNGRSLSQQQRVVWQERAKELSRGGSVLHSSSDVLDSLQKCFDLLDPMGIECFQDLGLFPEDQRIPAAALVDMWTELYGDDDTSALANIYKLVNWNLADIVVTRNVESETVDYSYHYVMQHDLLRELAILQTSQKPEAERNKLILDISGNDLPKWWTTEKEYHIKARVLSISTDEAFATEWCNLEPSEVEALVLNIRAAKFTLPMFMKKMRKLKVLIVSNYDFFQMELNNSQLLGYLSELKRIRFEKVSVPFLGKAGIQLKNLQKISLFMCNVNEAFENCTTEVSEMLPSLLEINIDYCNMVALPNGISNIVSLKKLSITKCHKLSQLPEGIKNLVNLESLRVSSCVSLAELPESITRLRNLKLLDISECISISNLPEKVGELCSLRKLNVRGCSNLSELPSSIMDLGNLRDVICDEETKELWEDLKTTLNGLNIVVVQADINLHWLHH